MRLMAICHDSVGIGHLRRTFAIAEQATRTIPSCRVLVLSGSLHAAHFTLPQRVDYVKLPALCKGPDYRYCAKSLGISFADTVAVRSSIITATAASFRPDVLLVDKSPLGVQGENEKAIRLVKDRYPATRTIFGMRDIEDAPDVTIDEWRRNGQYDALARYFDEIWVYGDSRVFDVAEAYQLPESITRKLRYVGYVSKPDCGHEHVDDPSRNGSLRLLVTVGGGTDGFSLLDQFLSDPVARVGERPVETTIVGGPDLPRAQAVQLRQRAAAIEGVTFRDVMPCMMCAYRGVDAVLTMGGYNTMVEVVRTGRRMLVYPRVEPRLEQYIRAKRFALLHLCEALDPNCMTPARLHAAVERLLSHSGPKTAWHPNLDGLTNVARRLSRLEATIRDSMAVFV